MGVELSKGGQYRVVLDLSQGGQNQVDVDLSHIERQKDDTTIN